MKIDETPYLLWYGEKPNLKHIRVLGCVVYTHTPNRNHKKLHKKGQKLRFIGYTTTTTNYKVWDKEKHKCYVRHNVIFNEKDFGKSTDTNELELENLKETNAEVPIESEKEESDEEMEEPPEPLRCSQRVSRPPVCYDIDEFTNIAYVRSHIAYQAIKIVEPNTIDDAFNSDHSQEWKKAANLEYSSLMENQTWSLVKLPKDCNAVGCKWVFRVKYDGNGKVKCFKGRLVAQGFL